MVFWDCLPGNPHIFHHRMLRTPSWRGRSQPERAGITAKIVPGWTKGSNLLKYCLQIPDMPAGNRSTNCWRMDFGCWKRLDSYGNSRNVPWGILMLTSSLVGGFSKGDGSHEHIRHIPMVGSWDWNELLAMLGFRQTSIIYKYTYIHILLYYYYYYSYLFCIFSLLFLLLLLFFHYYHYHYIFYILCYIYYYHYFHYHYQYSIIIHIYIYIHIWWI